jgi:hypothetical protein
MMRLVKVGFLSLTAAALLAAGGVAAASSADGNVDPMPAGTQIMVSGHHVTLPKAWAHLTIADLAKLGIHPGMGARVEDYPPSAASGDMPAGTRITLPDGRHVTLPEAWTEMTIADLARIGIHSDMGPRIEDTRAAVRPDSANSCDLDVCIYVTGSGLRVNYWQTTGDYEGPTPVCVYSVYWAPANTIYSTGIPVCGGEGTYYSYDKDVPIIWGGNVTLCNSWTEMYGKPCVGVHT